MNPNLVTSGWIAASLALLSGCTTLSNDPFLRAEQAVQRCDLAGALSAYDAVPVAHPRYPEARAAAAAVEQSMRHGHELMLEAMQLRGQWRDDEALIALQRARSVWPTVPGIDALLAATVQRRQSLAPALGAVARPLSPPAAPAAELIVVEAPPPPAAPMVNTAVTAASGLEQPAATPAAEVPAPGTAPKPEPVLTPSSADAPAEPRVASTTGGPPAAGATPGVAPAKVIATATEDPVSQALIAIELRLQRREVEPAVLDLLELERRFPEDLRIRPRLAKLLHQRALLRYGRGAVELATRDWQRVLTLDPQHADARTFLELALGERQQER